MLKRFADDRRGAVIVLFAIALVPLLAVVGVAIDYSRSTRTLADLQSAVDGAALAAGKNALDDSRRDIAEIRMLSVDERAPSRPWDRLGRRRTTRCPMHR